MICHRKLRMVLFATIDWYDDWMMVLIATRIISHRSTINSKLMLIWNILLQSKIDQQKLTAKWILLDPNLFTCKMKVLLQYDFSSKVKNGFDCMLHEWFWLIRRFNDGFDCKDWLVQWLNDGFDCNENHILRLYDEFQIYVDLEYTASIKDRRNISKRKQKSEF